MYYNFQTRSPMMNYKNMSVSITTLQETFSAQEGVWPRGVRTVECIVASEVDQCQLCLVDMQKGVDNEACIQNNDLYVCS